jgi:uncharacterized protein YbjQ (UPF0145 family)
MNLNPCAPTVLNQELDSRIVPSWNVTEYSGILLGRVVARKAASGDEVERADKRKANWTLKTQPVRDITDVFRSDAAIFRFLDTNAKTWGKVSNGGGVKKSTARDIAKEFVKFLRDFVGGEIRADGSQFDSDEASDIFEKRYASVAQDRTYEDLIRKL